VVVVQPIILPPHNTEQQMIDYNPKDWFTFIFRLHKTDTIRKLALMMVCICAYSGLVAYLETDVWKLADTSHVKNISLMHGLLGFVISLLLVFRTNTAYDRWWEARKLWGGLVNSSRNLAIKIAAMLDANDPERLFFKKAIPAFAIALKNHLHNEQTRVELFDKLPPALQERIDKNKHIPNQVALLLVQHANRLYKEAKISAEQLLMINNELQSFTDTCGACERIKNTPIPYSYSVFLKKFIFFYIMTLPFGYVFNLGYYVIPIVAFIFYVLASLELIAEEIEDPFDGDANDLPLDRICSNINKHVNELL
jgi:ion channel-forming bestrophin family protein